MKDPPSFIIPPTFANYTPSPTVGLPPLYLSLALFPNNSLTAASSCESLSV
jgi:hypothetical protein